MTNYEIPLFSDWVQGYDKRERELPHMAKRHKLRKISDADVLEVRRLLKSGMTTKQVALTVGISYHYVWYIQTGKRRTNVRESL